jgi:hypothetical protein
MKVIKTRNEEGRYEGKYSFLNFIDFRVMYAPLWWKCYLFDSQMKY